MLNGGGVLKAFDDRTTGSKEKGHVGGILQSSTYIAGLSGGSWAIGSVVVNNFTSIEDILKRKDVWDLETSIAAPEGTLAILDTISYLKELKKEVMSKREAGFLTTITDYWGRAISRQILISPKDNGAPASTFSSIADTKEFKEAEMPFPIVVADGRNPDETIISANSTVFEINPLEFGSFDPTLYKFTQTKYVGTNFTDGKPADKCVEGFDNAGFVLGTSSSLFNAGLLQLDTLGVDGTLKDLALTILTGLSDSSADIAAWSPNPFYSTKPLASQPLTSDRNLTLVDGGMDLQNIPLNPLIQPVRGLDAIIAADASADVNNWPNGTALVATYERSLHPQQQNGTAFPEIPSVNTFVNLGLNNKPTFFGCAWNDSLPEGTAQPPLIIYIPNSPYTSMSNFSTFARKYSTTDRDDVIENGYAVATMNNGSEDEEWPACLGCAILHRHLQRKTRSQTEQCKQCMTKYCWAGNRNDTEPVEYEPKVVSRGGKPRKSAGFRSYGVNVLGVVAIAGASAIALL